MLLLIILLGIIFTLGFGALVRHELVETEDSSALSRAALFLAEIPTNIERIYYLSTVRGANLPRASSEAAVYAEGNPNQIKFDLDEVTEEELNMFEGRSGFTAYTDNLQGYILMARSDPEQGGFLTELFDLGTQTVVAKWRDQEMSSPQLDQEFNLTYLGPDHQIVRVDACGKEIFRQTDYQYHHTFNYDDGGQLWSIAYPDKEKHLPGKAYDATFYHPDYKDDSLILIDNAGTVQKVISLTNIFIQQDLHNFLFIGMDDHFHPDPLHINDVQPVLEDGPYFNRGDLFVSLGHQNQLILLNPKTEVIKWRSSGEGLFHQHDVDVLNAEEIAVFDNNRVVLSKDFSFKTNTIEIYNFATSSWRTKFGDIMRTLEVKTVNQGLFELTESGLFVEEQNRGRLLFLNEQRLLWEFVNRDRTTGKIYQIHWSSLITATEHIEAIEQQLPQCST